MKRFFNPNTWGGCSNQARLHVHWGGWFQGWVGVSVGSGVNIFSFSILFPCQIEGHMVWVVEYLAIHLGSFGRPWQQMCQQAKQLSLCPQLPGMCMAFILSMSPKKLEASLRHLGWWELCCDCSALTHGVCGSFFFNQETLKPVDFC